MYLPLVIIAAMLVSISVADNTLRLFRQGRTLSPNERLNRCCQHRGHITDKCMPLCHYDKFTKEHLVKTLVHRSCALGELNDVLQCTARWADHSRCCEAKGVSSRCLDYCRPAFQPLSAEPQYFVCFTFIDKIRQCFHDYDVANPEYA